MNEDGNKGRPSWDAYEILVTGMARAEREKGEAFLYDGASLYPEDVADMLLPSMICLAQGVSRYVGMGELGYECVFEDDSEDAFPLAARRVGTEAPFHKVAPFLVEVFDSYVMENRADVSRVFEAAAQTIDPDFTLSRNARVGRDAAGMHVRASNEPRV